MRSTDVRPRRIRSTGAVLSAAALALSMLTAPATALPTSPPATTPTPTLEPTPEPRASVVIARLTRSSAPVGRRVLLRGTVTGGARTVELQTRDARGRWRPLARQNSDSNGRFSFTTPAWNRNHPLRVSASATLGAESVTSRVMRLRRYVPRTTGGSKSSWVPLDTRRGVTRWNPCTTHSVRVNLRHAPPWFSAEVRAALTDLHLYTGLNFVFAGSTPQRSPDWIGRWREADVVLLWTTSRADPRLAGPIVAIGGSWFKGRGRADGFVHFDRTARLDRAQWRLVLRHELAHVMGLGHTTDPRQRMHENASLVQTPSSIGDLWGRGDVTGLKRIGATHGCTD